MRHTTRPPRFAITTARTHARWPSLDAAALRRDGRRERRDAYLLDEHGYAVAARDHGGWTPQHVAAFYSLANVATLDLPLARGADPTEDTLGQNSAAHVRDAEFLRRLLDAGAHPDGGNFVPLADNPRAEVPQRPIARMVNKRDRDGIKMLGARGANVTADALELAAMFSPELVPLLVAGRARAERRPSRRGHRRRERRRDVPVAG